MPRAKMVEDVELPEENDEVTEEVEEEVVTTEDVDDIDDEEEWDSTKMDPDEALWEGGPNFGQINAWKKQFGDVYVTTVAPDYHVVWRTLTRFEYRRLVKNLEQSLSTGQVSQSEANMNNEEQIAELCVLFPQYSRATSAKELAGVASTIAQQVMEASAFSPVEVRQL